VVAATLSTESDDMRRELRDQLAGKLNLREIDEGQDLALELFRPHDGWGLLKETEEDLASADITRQYMAAVEFVKGLLVPQNFQKALPVFQKLADAGDPAGLIGLGVMYRGGFGVEPDLVEAYVLYRVARDRGSAEFKDEAERVLTELEMEMSPDLIDYARKRSMKWQPKQL
jgi:TPR repeat protein